MVETWHYAHRVPSIVVAVGMYVDDVLAGCITYGIPPSPNVQRCCGEKHRLNTLELNRLYIHDWAGRNAESWLIGQSFKILRLSYPEYPILVSYADIAFGHIGLIYRATNWIYTGTSLLDKTDTVIEGHHARQSVHLGGGKVAKMLGGVIIPRSLKHRYVYFLGGKSQRKELRKALRWPVLPYPKMSPS